MDSMRASPSSDRLRVSPSAVGSTRVCIFCQTLASGSEFARQKRSALSRPHQGVVEVVGVDPLDSVYSYDPDTRELDVNYHNHGPESIVGSARFTYKEFDDGKKFFLSHEGLYNEDFTKRNDVVAVLDQKDYGFYYEEAIAWLATKKH